MDTILDKVKKVMEYKDDEINAIPYNLALIHYKRNYWKILYFLIKNKT